MVFTTVNPPFSGGMVTRTTPGRTPAGRLPLPAKVRLPADFSAVRTYPSRAGSPLPAVGAHGVTRPTEIGS